MVLLFYGRKQWSLLYDLLNYWRGWEKKQVPRSSLYNGRMDVRTNTEICDGRVGPENKGKDPYYNETIKAGDELLSKDLHQV